MIKNDKQLGTPFIDYKDTKSNIEAIQGLVGGETAYSLQGQWGYYNHVTGAWVWVTNAGGGGAGVSVHNDLTGLQGGQAGQYYHLNQTQHTQLVSGTFTALHFHSGTHNNLEGIQGGQSGQYFHLNSTQINGLVSGSYTNLHFHSGTVAQDINSAPSGTPVNADRFGFWQSATGLLRHVTWAVIKATLKQSWIYMVHWNANTIPASTTHYNWVGNDVAPSTTERGNAFPRASTAKNLYIRIATNQPVSGTLVCTLRVGGVDTALVVTIAAGAVGGVTYSNTSDTVAISAGDSLDIKVQNNATGASAQITGITFELEFSVT